MGACGHRAGDDVEEINLNAANHPHAFSNMVTVLFQNEFRKGAAKERPGARTKGLSAGSSRGFARVLANFVPSNDPATDMAQFWRRCVHSGLGEDKLKAVRLMRHFQSAVSTLPSWLSSTAPLGTVNVEETAGRPLFGAQPDADNLPEFSKCGRRRLHAASLRAAAEAAVPGSPANVCVRAGAATADDICAAAGTAAAAPIAIR